MSNKVEVEYVNYDPDLHKDFPILVSCKVFSLQGILNVYLETSWYFEQIIDDIGYDSGGRHLLLSIGQWCHSETGLCVSNEEFYDLSEQESYNYDYVSLNIKIYTKEDYRACYHNDLDKRLAISFIPYKMLKFNDNNAGKKIFTYKVK